MTRPELWTLQTSSARSAPRRAQRAEAAGWDGMGVTDSQNLAGDAWVALAAAATTTTTLGLGTAVTNPVTRHPAVTASAAASVAALAGDRVVVGIGRGDSALAHLGRAPAPTAVLERYVRALRAYLRGDAVAFDDLATLDDLDDLDAAAPRVETLGLAGTPTASRLRWLPTGSTAVPVEVAATGPRVIAAAARTADRVLLALGADPARLRWGIELARRARAEAGLDPAGFGFGAYVNVVAHPDVDVARRLASGALATFARFSVMHGTVSGPVDGDQRAVLQAVHDSYDMTRHTRTGSSQAQVLTDDFVDRYAVVGPAGRCVERLQELAELGVARIVVVGVSPGSDRDDAVRADAVMAESVLPAL